MITLLQQIRVRTDDRTKLKLQQIALEFQVQLSDVTRWAITDFVHKYETLKDHADKKATTPEITNETKKH